MKQMNFNLSKAGLHNPWGFRIQGGRDFNRPLIISRITCDSVADNSGLKCGDRITKINNFDTGFICHNEAQQVIIESGNTLNLEITRDPLPVAENLKQTPFTVPKFPSSTNCNSIAPRTGLAGDIQLSHSNFDLKHRAPCCHGCTTEIRGPFIVVLDYCFCPNHFTCSYCFNDLSRGSFFEVKGLFYCPEDYSNFIAAHCEKCHKPIVGNEVSAMDTKWHYGCFKCNRCEIPLGDQLFKVGDDQMPYCENDWNELFQVKCLKCRGPITILDKFIEIGTSSYHAKCFCCSACKMSLEGKPFHNRNGKPFCRVHANTASMF